MSKGVKITYETSHESIPLTQEHDYIGEFHMATKKQIYNHMKRP